MTTLKNAEFHTATALGFFDGVHKGHMSLIKKAAELAQGNVKSLVYTFDLHPAEILGKKPKLITTHGEKIALLKESGVDNVYVQKVTREFLNLSTEDFVTDILKNTLHAKVVVVGENYTFGKNKEGNAELLKKLCEKHGIECVVMPYIKELSTIISSSAVREFIENGEIEKANALLGRCYAICGEGERGRGDGKKMGFPTVNIIPKEGKVLPPFGVYATQVNVDGKQYKAITNLGVAPTFGENRLFAETNILDFSGNLYGKNLSVEFLKIMRLEKKFDNVNELKTQIAKDILQRKNI